MAAEPFTLAGVAWRLVAVLFLVLLNGFFVASEFAIVKVRASQLEALAREGHKGARAARALVDRLDAYLSATQLGITLASLGLGWIGEPAVAVLLEPVFATFYVDNPALVSTISFIVAFAIITFLHIVLGELAPKSLAIQNARGVTLAVVLPLRMFHFIFSPAIWALNGTANWILRRIGIRPASGEELAHSEEELRMLLAESGRARALPRRRAEILLGVLDLRELTVGDIMVPRPNITALSAALPLEENFRLARESGYTRLPLTRTGDLDDLVGMIHFKDLVWFRETSPPDADITSIRREMLVVPDSLPVESLLNRFLARRAHMALAIDEYGGTAGLVTLEDVLEEFLGEIQDEFDTEEAVLIRSVGEGEWLIDGAAPLHRVSEAVEVELESRDATTFGGYVVEQVGRVPAAGTEVVFAGLRAVVRAADRKRVKSVHVSRVRRA